MTKTNNGSLILTQAVRPRIRIADLSKVTGIGRPRLRRLMHGALPNAGEMAQLRVALDIPLEAWTTEVDAEEVSDARDE